MAGNELPERDPEVGQLVHVRSRRWLVEEVRPGDKPGESSVVRLACAEDDAQGEEIEVFWDVELDRRVLKQEGWGQLAARGFDTPRRFAAFLHALRWNCVTATDPNLFQAPFRAGIKLDAYQMAPLRKALRMPRVNLFIADDTGLGKTIERCRTLLARSRDWVRFEVEPFRNALSCSLELMGGEPLRRALTESGQTVWTLPDLDGQARGDPAWAGTLDSLRRPRRRDQRVADWRKQEPPRPVVFEDAGVLTDETVHLHLEQRLARRLLARFRSQGFLHHDLSRACLSQAADSIPRVVLLGRLALYGGRAERLHEEVVAVTARWIEPERRQEPLRAYAREAEGRTLDLLEASLSGSGPRPVGEAVERRLLPAATRDILELRPRLEPRARELAATATKRLRERGERESSELRAILERQRQRVRDELDAGERDFAQRTLSFSREEERQLRADMRSWRARLERFDRDLDREPRRVREFYEVKVAPPVEPLGIVYLWPETN